VAVGILAEAGLVGVDAVCKRAPAGPRAQAGVQQLASLDQLRMAVDDPDAGL